MLSIIRANCVTCEKVLEFHNFAEFKDQSISEILEPIIGMTLEGTVIVCSACGTRNTVKYDNDEKKAYLEEANGDKTA